MYYSKIIPDPKPTKCQGREHAFRAYFQDNDEALGHAAVLLGGRRGARLINAVREALSHHRPFSLRLRLQLLELRNLLFLEHAYDENWGDDAGFRLPEPTDPIIPEICLLADGWEQALHNSGMIKKEGYETA
tara:strand:- start:1510 stop:1905 length:396 start_codon:yes stop_codon:yes gene_type:complete